ncbi:MAG: hypothetical protein JEY94_00670 [Melioribacteraceae bacterium]|nr:hypothetical protein [Melioribacteraceae bacterium]
MSKGTNGSDLKVVATKSGNNIPKLVVNSLKSGLFGYVIFFTILALTKLISSQIVNSNQFIIESDDALLSLIGFLLAFLIKLVNEITSNKELFS